MPELLETDISDGEEAPDDDPFEVAGERTPEAAFEGVGEEFVLNIDDVPEEEDRSEPLDSAADAKTWWPWANREEALLDIMTAFRDLYFRSRSLTRQDGLLPNAGSKTFRVLAKLKIIGAKFSSSAERTQASLKASSETFFPEQGSGTLRPYIRVLSEDSAERLDEACQAQKWKLEVAADLSGPMARHENKDYFVNEPALANIGTLGEYAAVPPSRGFLRKGKIWAKVQRLISHPR
ncbi:hypothetical protein B0H14DRAFT_2556105 [Mycena olivaceomarginata]|nr:hypothetical protein B0H14DRAFT_2556105 [Mycena olivaceomarginata]